MGLLDAMKRRSRVKMVASTDDGATDKGPSSTPSIPGLPGVSFEGGTPTVDAGSDDTQVAQAVPMASVKSPVASIAKKVKKLF